MKTFSQRNRRRWRWWAISTVVVLAVLLAMGWALLIFSDDVGGRRFTYLCVVGTMQTIEAFVLGQAVNSICVKSWDTWLGELGPTQVDMLIPALQEHKVKMLKEEKS